MVTAILRFHGELNDFLPRDWRGVDINVNFNGHETVKHVIESKGVPHTEVDVILVNKISVEFDHRLKPGERVDVYPNRENVQDVVAICLKPRPLESIRFVLDGHLGKLATYLRLLGFDTLYRNDFEDDDLAAISSNEDRILLTRDRGLLKRSLVNHGYYVREKLPKMQLVEIVKRFELTNQARPFSRCANCNGILTPIPKSDVMDKLEPKTKIHYQEFRICSDCNQIYWKGSHFNKLSRFINDVLGVRH